MKRSEGHGAEDRPIFIPAERNADHRIKQQFYCDVHVTDPEYDPLGTAEYRVKQTERQIFDKSVQLNGRPVFLKGEIPEQDPVRDGNTAGLVVVLYAVTYGRAQKHRQSRKHKDRGVLREFTPFSFPDNRARGDLFFHIHAPSPRVSHRSTRTI